MATLLRVPLLLFIPFNSIPQKNGKIKSLEKNKKVWYLAWKGSLSAPFRAWLTILGIAIGTFALTAMGSMALHFHKMAERFEMYVNGKLFVREEAGFFGGGAIPEQEATMLKAQKGIQEAIPILVARLETKQILSLGFPQIVLGIPLKKIPLLFGDIPMAKGRLPQNRDECVLGADLASTSKNNDFFYLGKHFQVSGVLARTNGQEDEEVLISLRTLEDLLGRHGLVSYVVLFPSGHIPLQELEKEIKKVDSHLQVIPPTVLKKEIRQNELLWDALTVGTGAIAVLVGGIGILTVMMMAVQERIREIAVAKAMGASSQQIFFIFFLEASILALAGTCLGFVLGIVFLKCVNNFLSQHRHVPFEPSLSLMEVNFFLALLLAVAGGFYPAWYGMRLEIASALRR